MEVFTAIRDGNTEPKSLAARRKTSERGMRILCDYLTLIGILTKEATCYSLTPDSAMFLDRRSRAYNGSAVKFLTSLALTDGIKDVAAAVRTGGTVMSEEGSTAPSFIISSVWKE